MNGLIHGPCSAGCHPTWRDHCIDLFAPHEGGHYVYLCMRRDDRPAYVGYTSNPRKRMQQHARKSWWADVREVHWISFTSAAEARAVELGIICALRPEGNRQGVVGRTGVAA